MLSIHEQTPRGKRAAALSLCAPAVRPTLAPSDAAFPELVRPDREASP